MRILTAILCLLTLLTASASAAVSVRMEDTAALLTEAGGTVIAAGTYADIVPLEDGRFAARTDGLYRLMDADGVCLTDALYDQIVAGNGGYRTEKDGRWGILDPQGRVLAKTEYRDVRFDGEGAFWTVSEEGILGKVRPNGTAEELNLSVLRVADAPSDGLLCVQSAENGRFGYVDSDGKYAIAPEFDFAAPFQRGIAVVTVGGGCGAIDASGAFVLQAAYDSVEIGGTDFLLAQKRGEGAFVFDLAGNRIAGFPGEGITAAVVGDAWLICDRGSVRAYAADGTELYSAGPDATVLAGIDGALIAAEGAWGEKCVHLVGSEVLYQDLFPLGRSGGEAVYGCLEVPAARYMNDLLGEIQLSADMDYARYGLVDVRGEALTECAYLSAAYLADDRFQVRTEEAWQVIDAHGNIIWSAPASAQASG